MSAPDPTVCLDGSVLSVMKRYGISIPAICRDAHGVWNVELKTMVVDLRTSHSSIPLLAGLTGTVKIIAIICEECVVSHSDSPVCVNSVGGHTKAEGTDEPLIARTAHLASKAFTDIILPGQNTQAIHRIWFAPAPYAPVLQKFGPEILADRGDIRRGVVHVPNQLGLSEFHVTHEADGDDGRLLCPLGRFVQIWYTHVSKGDLSAPPEVDVQCSGQRRRGYVLNKKLRDTFVDRLATYLRDPRLEVSADSFLLEGTCSSIKWALSMRLIVLYSKQT